MFKVFIDGNDDRLRLENEFGDVIGWIRGNGFAFSGLPSEAAAIRAAVESWSPLEHTLERGYPGRAPRPINKSAVRIVHDGAYEWIADGVRPIARLLRPQTARNPDDSFGLEFMVPSYATQHVTIAVAQAVWEVVSTHVALQTADMSPPARAERAFALAD